MSHDRKYQRHITICLNDSIFKDKRQERNKKEDKTTTYINNIREKKSIIHQPIMITHNHKDQQQRVLLQYLNGSYFGKTTPNSSDPLGVGIFIDDQFNFFLSQFQPSHTMNSLTLIILLNGVRLYGSWIDGKPNGWNCIQLSLGVKIFVQFKTSYQGKCNVSSPLIIVNEIKKTAYLTEVELSEKLYTKIRIRNRKNIRQLKDKRGNIVGGNVKDIFQQLVNLKIPHFLLSFEDFLIHLNQNVQDVEIKKINKNSELLTSISLKDVGDAKNNDKLSCFLPFPELLQQNQKISQKSNKKLGILLSQKADRIKTIGQFSQGYQLSGRGITFTSFSTGPLFGIFKSDMLVKEFSHPEPFSTKLLHSCQLKKQLTQYHMKSTNFVHNFVYFNEVDSVLQLMNNVNEFVNIFEDEYSKRHGKEIDSYSQSENQYEEGKYYQQVAGEENEEHIKGNAFNQLNNEFEKRVITGQVLMSSTQKQRPFGRIVKSRSPLRQIPDHSRSKSPSQIQTKRDRNISPSPNIIDKRSQKKDLFISINSFFNYASNKYNVETTKNRSKECSVKQLTHDKKPRYFLAHNHQQQLYREEDVMQTIRLKDESKVRSLYGQSQIDQLGSNLYSRHLRNNYIKKK